MELDNILARVGSGCPHDVDSRRHPPEGFSQVDICGEVVVVVAGFEQADGFVIGYRTRKAGHIDEYRDGRYYSADWFSTCPETECHPGLYLWPTVEAARGWSPNAALIRVRTKPGEVHHVGSKWRCRWFEVLGSVESER